MKKGEPGYNKLLEYQNRKYRENAEYREQRKEYARNYKKNAAQKLQHNKRRKFRYDNDAVYREQVRESARRYYVAHKEEVKFRNKQYYETHKEIIKEKKHKGML